MTKPESSHQQRYIIDRFEDNGWAVLEVEAGVTFDVPGDWLPEGAKEGDLLRLDVDRSADQATVRFALDKDEGEERKRRVRSKLDQLRRKKK